MNKAYIPILTIIFLILFLIFLPIYDNVNGFYNFLFDNYKITWHDGRSPANFNVIKIILEKGFPIFPKGYLIGDIKVENLFDFVEKNGYFYPVFGVFVDYLYAGLLFLIPILSDLQLFKGILLLNMIFSIITLAIFYYLQRLLNLKVLYSSLSTLIAGIATSILIYSRYLFIYDILINLTFLLLIYFLINYRKKSTFKMEILISSVFLIFLLFVFHQYLTPIFFIILSYLFIKYKVVRPKLLALVGLLSVLIMAPIYSFYVENARESITEIEYTFSIAGKPIFAVFPNYINALDYEIFGYHNSSSVWKLQRDFPRIYAFEEANGNAIFLSFYGLFGSLFGAKGIIYNSPYLIFSILGIFLCKEIKEKKLLLFFIVMFILVYGLLHPMWYGGVTPRYNRFLTIPALFLTFFSFYYIQEVSKEKNKTKKYFIYLIFVILVSLSILNVTSIAVRTDWTYEHEANLVSYDLVLWPWYPPKLQENIFNLYLTEQGESIEWKFGGQTNECKSYGNLEGIVTYMCNCQYDNYAERNIEIPWEKIKVNVTACSRNGDGVIGKFYFDKTEKEIFIEPNSCKEESMLIENSKGEHTLILKPKIYEKCIDETIIWKLITIEKIQ